MAQKLFEMAGKKKNAAAKSKRAGGSQPGKKASKQPAPKAGRKVQRASVGAVIAARPSRGRLSDYARLIRDPCNAKLVNSVLPGPGGGIVVRLPFRWTFTVPNGTVGVDGVSAQAGAARTTVLACLVPHAMSTAAQPTMASFIAITGDNQNPDLSGSTDIATTTPWGKTTQWFDPTGMANLFPLAEKIRPIAACAKLGYMGGASSYTGTWVGYQGSALDFVTLSSATGNPNQFYPSCSYNTLAQYGEEVLSPLAGVAANLDLTKGDPQWKCFRPYTQSGTTQLCQPDATDADRSGMPSIVLGGANLTAGARMVMQGAVVYEFFPRYSAALDASVPQKVVTDPAAAKVSKEITDGPSLITRAVNFYQENSTFINAAGEVALTALGALAL